MEKVIFGNLNNLISDYLELYYLYHILAFLDTILLFFCSFFIVFCKPQKGNLSNLDY